MVLHPRVKTVAREQLLMPAALRDSAACHDEDLITGDDGFQSMRDQDDGAQSFQLS